MAKNKKSFVLYSDAYGLIKQLPDDIAGRLFKHIFAYVNDENPISEELLINVAFEPIKSQLKRDLQKWEKQMEQRRNAGLRSAEVRKQNATKVNERSISSTVNDNVNVNVNINNKLLSEIEISDVDISLKDYFNIAKEFQRLFIKNLQEKNISTKTQEKATFKNYVTPIRLMIENNECTLQDLRDVWTYLKSPNSEFWKKNILSTATLRKQIIRLIFEAKKQ